MNPLSFAIPPQLRLALKLAPYVVIVALCVALALTRASLAREKASAKAAAAMVIAKTAEAQAEDLAHARVVEAAQAQTTKEVSSAYQNDLAALRARLERLRASAGKGGGGTKGVPVLPHPASGPDAEAARDPLPYDLTGLMFEAEANTLQLIALQDWVKAQQRISGQSK